MRNRGIFIGKIVNSSDRNCLRCLSDIASAELKMSWKAVL
jgi:hypothetical protein